MTRRTFFGRMNVHTNKCIFVKLSHVEVSQKGEGKKRVNVKNFILTLVKQSEMPH